MKDALRHALWLPVSVGRHSRRYGLRSTPLFKANANFVAQAASAACGRQMVMKNNAIANGIASITADQVLLVPSSVTITALNGGGQPTSEDAAAAICMVAIAAQTNDWVMGASSSGSAS